MLQVRSLRFAAASMFVCLVFAMLAPALASAPAECCDSLRCASCEHPAPPLMAGCCQQDEQASPLAVLPKLPPSTELPITEIRRSHPYLSLPSPSSRALLTEAESICAGRLAPSRICIFQL